MVTRTTKALGLALALALLAVLPAVREADAWTCQCSGKQPCSGAQSCPDSGELAQASGGNVYLEFLDSWNLADTDGFGANAAESDPYIEATYDFGDGVAKDRTEVQHDTNRASWDRVLDMGYMPSGAPITLKIMDADSGLELGDDEMWKGEPPVLNVIMCHDLYAEELEFECGRPFGCKVGDSSFRMPVRQGCVENGTVTFNSIDGGKSVLYVRMTVIAFQAELEKFDTNYRGASLPIVSTAVENVGQLAFLNDDDVEDSLNEVYADWTTQLSSIPDELRGALIVQTFNPVFGGTASDAFIEETHPYMYVAVNTRAFIYVCRYAQQLPDLDEDGGLPKWMTPYQELVQVRPTTDIDYRCWRRSVPATSKNKWGGVTENYITLYGNRPTASGDAFATDANYIVFAVPTRQNIKEDSYTITFGVSSFWVYLVAHGFPFAFVLLAWLTLLNRIDFRLNRVNTYLVSRVMAGKEKNLIAALFSGYADSPNNVEFRAHLYHATRAMFVMMLWPIVQLWTWGFSSVAAIDPPAVGYAIGFMGTSALLFYSAFQLWKRQSWRMDSTALVVFVVSLLFFLMFLISVVFADPAVYEGHEDPDFTALSFAFGTLNVMPMILLAFKHDKAFRRNLTEFMRTMTDVIRGEIDTYGKPVVSHGGAGDEGEGRRGPKRKTLQTAAALHRLLGDAYTVHPVLPAFRFAGVINTALSSTKSGGSKRRKWWAIFNTSEYPCALLFLFIYVVIAAARTRHGMMAFLNCFALTLLDSIHEGISHGSSEWSPGYAIMLLVGGRLAVMGGGANLWLVGYSIAYVIYGVALTREIIKASLPKLSKAAAGKIAFLGAPVQAAPSSDIAGNPSFMMGVLTFFFLAVISIAAFGSSQTVVLTNVHVGSEVWPTTAFGMIAILVVVVSGLIMATLRAFYLAKNDLLRGWARDAYLFFKTLSLPVVLALVSQVALITAGLLINGATGNTAILVLSFFLPTIMALFANAYSIWKMNDHDLVVWPPREREEALVDATPSDLEVAFNMIGSLFGPGASGGAATQSSVQFALTDGVDGEERPEVDDDSNGEGGKGKRGRKKENGANDENDVDDDGIDTRDPPGGQRPTMGTFSLPPLQKTGSQVDGEIKMPPLPLKSVLRKKRAQALANRGSPGPGGAGGHAALGAHFTSNLDEGGEMFGSGAAMQEDLARGNPDDPWNQMIADAGGDLFDGGDEMDEEDEEAEEHQGRHDSGGADGTQASGGPDGPGGKGTRARKRRGWAMSLKDIEAKMKEYPATQWLLRVIMRCKQCAGGGGSKGKYGRPVRVVHHDDEDGSGKKRRKKKNTGDGDDDDSEEEESDQDEADAALSRLADEDDFNDDDEEHHLEDEEEEVDGYGNRPPEDEYDPDAEPDLESMNFWKAAAAGYLLKEEYLALLSWFGALFLVMLLGIVLSKTERPAFLGHLLWVGIFELLFTAIPIYRYFQTYVVDQTTKEFAVVTAVLHFVFCLSFFLGPMDGAENKEGSLWILDFFFYYPVLVYLVFSVTNWADNGWVIPKVDDDGDGEVTAWEALRYLKLWPFLFCMGVLLVWHFFSFMNAIAGAIVLLVLLLSVVAYVFLRDWSLNDFYLSPIYQVAASYIVSFVMFISFLVAMFSSEPLFAWSLFFFCHIFRALSIVLMKYMEMEKDSLVFFSPYVFPMYVYDSRANDLADETETAKTLFSALGGGLAWGVTMAIFLYPVSVGIGVASIFIMGVMVAISYCISYVPLKLGKLAALVEPSAMTEAAEAAVKKFNERQQPFQISYGEWDDVDAQQWGINQGTGKNDRMMRRVSGTWANIDGAAAEGDEEAGGGDEEYGDDGLLDKFQQEEAAAQVPFDKMSVVQLAMVIVNDTRSLRYMIDDNAATEAAKEADRVRKLAEVEGITIEEVLDREEEQARREGGWTRKISKAFGKLFSMLPSQGLGGYKIHSQALFSSKDVLAEALITGHGPLGFLGCGGAWYKLFQHAKQKENLKWLRQPWLNKFDEHGNRTDALQLHQTLDTRRRIAEMSTVDEHLNRRFHEENRTAVHFVTMLLVAADARLIREQVQFQKFFRENRFRLLSNGITPPAQLFGSASSSSIDVPLVAAWLSTLTPEERERFHLLKHNFAEEQLEHYERIDEEDCAFEREAEELAMQRKEVETTTCQQLYEEIRRRQHSRVEGFIASLETGYDRDRFKAVASQWLSTSNPYVAKEDTELYERFRNAVMGAGDETTAYAREVLNELESGQRDCRVAKDGRSYQYYDPVFPPEAASLGPVSCASDIVGWETGPSINAEAQLFDEGTDPDDVEQGNVQDNWLLSAVSMLTAEGAGVEGDVVQEQILNLFVGHLTEDGHPSFHTDVGAYCVRLYKQGQWVPVFLDDHLPMLREELWSASNRGVAVGHSKECAELWVSLVEKAYAKFYGSYAAVEQGYVHQALRDLTGAESEQIFLARMSRGAEKKALWDRLVRYKRNGYILGAGTFSSAATDQDLADSGIVFGLAYPIFQVRVVDGHHLIQIRNPPGVTEQWKGDWGPKSAVWTKRLKGKVGFDEDDHTTSWISFDDFCNVFRVVYVCRWYADRKWKTTTIHGQWSTNYQVDGSGGASQEYGGVSDTAIGDGAAPSQEPEVVNTAGGLPHKDNPGCELQNNPHYLLKISRPTDLRISLSQTDARGVSAQEMLPCAMYVVRSPHGARGGRIKTLVKDNVVQASGEPTRERTQHMYVSLKPGNYILLCGTYVVGMEGPFTFNILSNFALNVEPIWPATYEQLGGDRLLEASAHAASSGVSAINRKLEKCSYFLFKKAAELHEAALTREERRDAKDEEADREAKMEQERVARDMNKHAAESGAGRNPKQDTGDEEEGGDSGDAGGAVTPGRSAKVAPMT